MHHPDGLAIDSVAAPDFVIACLGKEVRLHQLERLLARFEEGARLARICQFKLTEAELKIQQLETNATGELTLKPVNLAENSAAE